MKCEMKRRFTIFLYALLVGVLVLGAYTLFFNGRSRQTSVGGKSVQVALDIGLVGRHAGQRHPNSIANQESR